MPCLYIRREKCKKTFNPLFALSGARARGIAAEPPSRRSAKRKAVKVMERIARRERRNAAKRLAQNHQKTKKIKPIENKLF
jgi:mannose/cellobiose epimerase-like protein (N-acyl-D-glucosamine 2-epimerase family)